MEKESFTYKDIAENVKARFDAWNYRLERSIPKGKNKKGKVIDLIKE